MAEKHYLDGATKVGMATMGAAAMGKGMGITAVVFFGTVFFVVALAFIGQFLPDRSREAPYPNTIFQVNDIDGTVDGKYTRFAN
ncbi:hypothetical protein CCR83_14270 [Rhodobacter veldkampii DSM 11550]|uniref:PufX n=2 Tax=Phaeovulum veldkampii TaxID=33049 RepID=A0A2T4JIP3_9RHOB|nr:RC-LH1 core complex protein PufX [Phaeovulum veldkampii]7DDQ_X Chain X, PufX [Phaeovulum veldkampii DSM 11550]MBK5947581.1 hypothetical protein [Phaeovulum veldkampii DSM 11550]PTE17765.1 hypothetical protein C5F46_07925 [Phaeovulum veldkampii DSM 11550]TDQ58162.1 intrinsic membrane protein PufX [Phaeovulum veldkampii DSM 11550]BAD44691.1 PufX [Phaeovulum veldkampii DSM 11550]